MSMTADTAGKVYAFPEKYLERARIEKALFRQGYDLVAYFHYEKYLWAAYVPRGEACPISSMAFEKKESVGYVFHHASDDWSLGQLCNYISIYDVTTTIHAPFVMGMASHSPCDSLGRVIPFPGVVLPSDVATTEKLQVTWASREAYLQTREKLLVLGVPARAMRILSHMGVSDIQGLIAIDIDNLTRYSGIGKKTIAELREIIALHRAAMREG